MVVLIYNLISIIFHFILIKLAKKNEFSSLSCGARDIIINILF